jgi:uncharacterized protein
MRRLVFIFALLGCALAARAEDPARLRATNYVNDYAAVVSSSEAQRLNELLRDLDQQAHAQVSVVTVRSLNGLPVEDFANRLFNHWGIGGKQNRGVLILLVPTAHKYRIEVGYALEPILPDGKVGGFGREAVPALRRGDYDTAVSLMARRVAQTVAADSHVQLPELAAGPVRGAVPPSRASRPPANAMAPWAILLFITGFLVVFATPFALFIWLAKKAIASPKLMAMLQSAGAARGSGSSGSGNSSSSSESSSSGGGGFGGFSGGSSGGGGASGSW